MQLARNGLPGLVREWTKLSLASQASVHHHRERDLDIRRFLGMRNRGRRPNRHRDERYREERQKKFFPIELPFDREFRERQKMGTLTQMEMNEWMKEVGMDHGRSWQRERPLFLKSSEGVYDKYIPPEGDGKASPLSLRKFGDQAKEGITHRKGTALRRIKKDIPGWNEDDFVLQAQNDIYIPAHNLLNQVPEEEEALKLVTERALPIFLSELSLRSVVWEWLETLSPPRLVHAFSRESPGGAHHFAQVTLRIHSLQRLAIYDQWGRLIRGSESQPAEVLEYPVFEKDLLSSQSEWRLHDKIRPSWAPHQRFPKRLAFPLQKQIPSNA